MRHDLSPVVLFAYKRKETLQRSVEALKDCFLASECELYIFADGPKGKHDQKKVLEVRDYLKTINGFKNICIQLADKNKGISNSVIEGVAKIFSKSDRVIVLEDDVVVSRNFLLFMNENLSKYQNENSVFSISGYNYPFKVKKNEKYDAFFLPRASSWGWATWRDRWCDLDWDVKGYKDFALDKKQIREFHQAGSDLLRLLRKQQTEQMDVWDVRWVYNQFKKKSLTVYPTISKVRNIGFDDEATNTHTFNRYISKVDNGEKKSFDLPGYIALDSFYHNQLLQFYSIPSRIKSRIRTMLSTVGWIKKLLCLIYSSIIGLQLTLGINYFSDSFA
jgi:GR25 family glycosyltransferase involved in LPS biosynthesis